MWTRRLSEVSAAALLALTPVAAQAAPPPASSMDDPMEQFRERFKQGMERYKAGAPAEAIGYWEPIYRELGEQKGYRLAYNLGVAYAELGDATRAAEKLQSFLAEVDARRGRGETLGQIVTKEEADGRERVAELNSTKGRVHVEAGTPPRAAQVDASEPRLAGFIAWVTPGEHTVVFAPGTPDQESKSLLVHAGELVDVSPTPPPPSPPPAAVSVPPASPSTLPPAPPPAAPVVRHEVDHPFSPAVLVIGGALAVGAGVASVPLASSAWSYRESAATNKANGDAFYAARTAYYVTLTSAIGLAAATAGLTGWYFLGTSSREVVVTPGGIAGRF